MAGIGDNFVGDRARKLSRVTPEQWYIGGPTHQARQYGRRSMSGRENN